METDLGGQGRAFPRTSTRLQEALQDPAAREAVMAMLAERYWKPVYFFVRRAYAKPVEDAKDLTQAFFVWLLERDLLRRYDPAACSFRTFLKGLLRNFSGNEHQGALRLKRGGGLSIRALTDDIPGTTSDEAFDLSWKKELVDRALAKVRERYLKRMVPWLVFEASLEGGSYVELAARYGVKEGDVRNYLREVRSRIRTEVAAELEATGEADDYADEVIGRWASDPPA